MLISTCDDLESHERAMRAAREGIRARPRDRGVMTCLVLVSQHNTQHDNDIMAPPRPGQRSQIALTRLAEVILITPRPDGPDRPRTDIKRLAFIFIFVGPVFFSRGTLLLALGGLYRAAAEVWA